MSHRERSDVSTLVDLGFIDKTEEDRSNFHPHYYSSKIGGKPAFLALTGLPIADRLKCGVCNKQMILLLQIYAPVEDVDTAFHRSLFVFTCVAIGCSGFYRVLRNQLSQMNSYYAFNPDDFDEDQTDDDDEVEVLAADFGTTLCDICGCLATQFCGRCKRTYYCSREHQVYDWKLGSHKTICNQDEIKKSSLVRKRAGILVPQFEILIEEEVIKTKSTNLGANADEINLDKIIQQFKPTLQDANVEEFVDDDEHSAVDKTFLRFKKVLTGNEEQIIRYHTDFNKKTCEPLWISSNHKPESIPNCANCGAERQFEFQVMPQLLNFIHKPQLDFGILAVYTCKAHCVSSRSKDLYLDEFIWCQNLI